MGRAELIYLRHWPSVATSKNEERDPQQKQKWWWWWWWRGFGKQKAATALEKRHRSGASRGLREVHVGSDLIGAPTSALDAGRVATKLQSENKTGPHPSSQTWICAPLRKLEGADHAQMLMLRATCRPTSEARIQLPSRQLRGQPPPSVLSAPGTESRHTLTSRNCLQAYEQHPSGVTSTARQLDVVATRVLGVDAVQSEAFGEVMVPSGLKFHIIDPLSKPFFSQHHR
ncbi:hypothetical protein DFJ73DRAFT_968674 [Zopfochytrium polystomum]|nr:hypothetical protein DFJ73DRAFT_968674 [Zopfochytrium polystomum]